MRGSVAMSIGAPRAPKVWGLSSTASGFVARVRSCRSIPGEGKVHAYAGRSTEAGGEKPMPDLRRGDRSCRDRATSSARQFRDPRILLRAMRAHQILGGDAFVSPAKTELDRFQARTRFSPGLFRENESGWEKIENASVDGALIAGARTPRNRVLCPRHAH